MTDKIEEIRKALEGSTRGPWNIIWEESVKVRDGTTFGTIASMGNLTKPHQGPRRDFDEVRNNARLIALAPDLARIVLAAEKLAKACAAIDETEGLPPEIGDAFDVYRKAVEGVE